MPTLTQVRNRVDQFITDRLAVFSARQENFRTNRGRYWQGLLTHTNVPAHTNSADGDSIADRLIQSPTDQLENWVTVFPEWSGESIPCALSVDVYDGPLGAGWILIIFIRYNGQLYRRAFNVGPDSSRSNPWTAVSEV